MAFYRIGADSKHVQSFNLDFRTQMAKTSRLISYVQQK